MSTTINTNLTLPKLYVDPNHSLYLYHSDQPGMVLVAQSLNQENYYIWSHAMLIALITKNKEGFIDDTIKRSSTNFEVEIKQWTRCNIPIKGWILNTISPKIAKSVMYNDTAYELCEELKERFSHTNNVHLFHIEQEIHDCIQECVSIGEYYTKLKSLGDSRDTLCPFPYCEGNSRRELQEYQQKQGTIKFLMGLNTAYTSARG